MLKPIKSLLENNAIYIAVFITISILFGSLVKSEFIVVESISVSDKTYHLIAYFLLMLSWLYAFFKKEKFQEHVKYIILGCFIFGIIIEILQGIITSYRTASYLDILANTIGVLLAVVIFHVFEKKISVF
ncbi:VanZ family protein [Flavobacteriaceae bacterium]|jgi:VanZ family protein|nr:VanZ family protein [Flavobacteriaceae bacterium]MDC1168583.1 VanZ family protein [Flavobacteriaceae bacterium]MDC3318733.1 VanZ family protein [Flavobacteriaceae bacterium]